MGDEAGRKSDGEAVRVGARRCRDAEGVSIEIRPEPTPEEREAILRALAALDDRKQGASAWWEAGIRESFEDDDVD
jgi:hypothetical protein